MHAPPPAQVTRSIGDWDAARPRTLHIPTPSPSYLNPDLSRMAAPSEPRPVAAVRTLTRASALVLTRHARASPSPSCAALRSHAVRARVHKLPRASVGSPRGKSAAPSAALASGLQGLRCSLGVARAHPFALGMLPSHRHPLAAAARQRRAVGRGQPRAGVQAGAQGADGAARRGLAAGHGAAHQQREARPHAVEKRSRRVVPQRIQDTSRRPAYAYIHSGTNGRSARGCPPSRARVGAAVLARGYLCIRPGVRGRVASAGARERDMFGATAQPDSPDRRPHRPPWPR